MVKLKKCPFCGGEAEINIRSFTDGYRIFYPRCKDRNCIASVILGVGSKTKEEAAEEWNRRVETEPVRHGRWKEVMTNVYIGCLGFEEATCNELECSECGYRINIEDHFVYCPSCGAKMDGVEE